MNYELASKLKEAGFPQKITDNLSHVLRDGKEVVFKGSAGRLATDLLLPSLSELIDACGDGFHTLTLIGGKIGWRATSPATGFQSSQTIKWIEKDAPSPEEAVANLWLELNTK